MGNYLEKPNTTKEIFLGDNPVLEYVAGEMQGWRVTMEDAIVAEPTFDINTSLFAIFDGHGGPEVAKFCSENFSATLKHNTNYMAGKYKKALEETFLEMDRMLIGIGKDHKDYEDLKDTYAGCTAMVCLMVGSKVYLANAGDCRCLVFNRNGVIYQMNREHKPNNPEEKARIAEAGGFIINGRINENLNLSRAIGDLSYKDNPGLGDTEQLIIAFPDVVEKDVAADDICMLMGCDGVFEKLSDPSLRNLVFEQLKEGKEPYMLMAELLDRCLGNLTLGQSNGLDNMSAIVVRFRQTPEVN